MKASRSAFLGVALGLLAVAAITTPASAELINFYCNPENSPEKRPFTWQTFWIDPEHGTITRGIPIYDRYDISYTRPVQITPGEYSWRDNGGTWRIDRARGRLYWSDAGGSGVLYCFKGSEPFPGVKF